MARTSILKIRVSGKEAREVERLAQQDKVSKTTVVREGIRLYALQHDRRAAAEELIEMIRGKEPPKIRWSLRR